MWWRVSLAAISVAISAIAIAVRFGPISIKIVADGAHPPPKPLMVDDVPLDLSVLVAFTVACVTPLALTLFRRRP